jgi:Zn-dependent M28 family amino/carboxypeptidase
MTKNLKRPRKLTFLIIIVLLLGFAYPAGIDAAPAKKQTQKKTSTSAKSTGSSASNRRRSPSHRRSAPTIARKSYDEMMGRSGSVGPGRAVSFGEIGEAEDIALLDETRMRSHIRFLADDLLEGRGTGSRGGLLAAKYIATQFEALGLEPAGMDRSYFQQVHMTGTKTDPSSLLVVRKDTSEAKFRFGDEFVASTDVEEPEVNVIGDLVFVGYGISAPEYNWDDYKGIDVRGKILLMMINDPPSTAAEPKLFGGPALTYYGRWTYKFEEAARRGANGVILIHTNETAGYGWNVVKNSFGGERFGLVADDKAQPLRIRGWVTDEAARGLVKIGGLDLNTLRLSAQTRDFRAQALNSHLDTKLKVTSRRLTAPNVAGVLRGSDPNLMNEYVVLTAHWDHLGIRPEQTGDNIYNGAVDNATGVAGMLSVAHWLSSYPTPPKRSVIFLATTAEEQGLLGAEYYTRYPFAPLSKTVATVNLDSMNVLGVTTDISPLGAERSTLGRVVESVARGAGVTITPDPRPEQGGFYRSDHFPFAKAGVPALNFKSGIRYVGHSETWAAEQFKEYNETRYHQPSDEYSPNWDFRGLVQQAKLASLIVSRIANALEIPQWNAGDEFAKARK